MAVFRYKMKNVLDVKLKMEDQAKAAFAEAMAILNAEEEKLQALIDRHDWYEEEGRRMRREAIDVNDLRDNTRALDNLKEQNSNLRTQLNMTNLAASQNQQTSQIINGINPAPIPAYMVQNPNGCNCGNLYNGLTA